jgi:protein-tyrosine-phosphatase
MRVLFICKGNICRSPAAMYYLQKRRPGWFVESKASTTNTEGRHIHPKMINALEAKLIPCNRGRMVKGPEVPGTDFNRIIDLHRAGIQDPYITGDFDGALEEIINYVDSNLLSP